MAESDLNPASLAAASFFCPILLLLFRFFFYSSSRRRRAKTHPCPQSYPVIGNLIAFLRNRHRFHDWVAEMLAETPSSTLRVKTFLNLSNGICTADPLNIQHLLAVNFPNYIKGSRNYDVLHDLIGNGIFAVDGQLWAAQRKVASYEFSTKSLKHFISDTVNFEITHRLIPFLSEACEQNRVIDLQEILQKFAFDNICNVAFGVDPNSLNTKSASDSASFAFARAFDDATQIISSRLMSPLPVIWKIERFLNIRSGKQFKDAMEVVDGFVLSIIQSKEELIESRKAEEGDEATINQDLLWRFMQWSLAHEFDNQDRRRKFLRDIVTSFMLTGKDTTSTALTWFFWLIAGHPQSEGRILAELSENKKSSGRTFTYDELKKLHYTHAAVSETMRLFPPLPIDSRVVVNDDILPDGNHVQKGWFADYSAYAMGRNREVWGEDCREFKPERWLDDAGMYQPSDQFRYPVFHSGPLMCLGKEMAYVQMKSIAAAVMGEFEVLPVGGGGTVEKMVAPPYSLSLILKMKGGLPVRLKKRASTKI